VGPLRGIKVIELAGLGPGPFAATLLSDMGADVVRIERTELVDRARHPTGSVFDARGRRALAVDLKHADGVETVLKMVEQADVLIEGFRPGVTERLGVGPDDCLARNPQLVYGRITGWGQEGPLAQAAGHDINYIALAGPLAHIGRSGERPVPPMNLLGDYGGGGMFLAFGALCALFEARRSGKGQIIDAAMVDGATYLMGSIWGMRGIKSFSEERGVNLLDTGAPFYDVYETADGEYISIGAIEPQFFAELLERLELSGDASPAQMDRSRWPEMRETFTAVFGSRTRSEWVERLEGTDICFAPVLSMSDVVQHPHIVARGSVIQHDGIDQPAPAPRFSRTNAQIAGPARFSGADTETVLASYGFTNREIANLIGSGAVRQRSD
jgi:alpha-methylacyl-CoA racemase